MDKEREGDPRLNSAQQTCPHPLRWIHISLMARVVWGRGTKMSLETLLSTVAVACWSCVMLVY